MHSFLWTALTTNRQVSILCIKFHMLNIHSYMLRDADIVSANEISAYKNHHFLTCDTR